MLFAGAGRSDHGFVTIGGASPSIAPTVRSCLYERAPERILEATWADVTHIQHAVDIEIEAGDRRPAARRDGVCAELKTRSPQ